MLCAHCANPIPDGSQFCLNCGADVQDPSPATTASLDDAGVARLTRWLREETAGEYEIEREIARGGMGVVYVATEIQLRRRVAIKVLPPALTFGEAAIQRFRREARTAAALDHPNIIPIHRVSAGGELMWYSMKLLEGQSLDTILKEKEQLAFEETIAILDQVADALDYAHQHGVIHRDIKPGNIVLDERGRVTVTDFGIAKELQEASLSASGHMLGTPYYMSPEQYLGAEVSGAADQYSLGVVAYQCLGRQLPFDAATAYELLNKHVSQPPPPLAELRPDLPTHAYPAIERALAKRPDERFPTVTDFANALAGRAHAGALPSRVTARRTTVLQWTAGLAAAVMALLGGMSLLRRESPAPPPVSASSTLQPETPAATGSQRPAPVPSPPSSPRQAPAATLIIRLTNGWARIYVDGDLRGERPVHREELPPGTHTLRFERPGFLPLDTTLTLRSGANVIEVGLRRATP
ncbi:MAG: protein kinase domain-containing protein [Gemmatimonadales bacterium]